MIGFAAFLAVVVATIAVPVAIYTAVRAVNRVLTATPNTLPPQSPELEMRLLRMEEAIDAMSQQVERLREASERRYVTEGDEQTPRLSRSLDSPPAP